MLLRVTGLSRFQSQTLPILCPGCGHKGNFTPIPGAEDLMAYSPTAIVFGSRHCPNEECQTLVFVLYSPPRGPVLASYPPGRLPWDAANVPPSVAAPFIEALTCHAHGCFVAAAMLVRKTMELLCDDRGLDRKSNLKERIADLRSKAILPEPLLVAADSIRLLGNDAAHIEAKTYDEVGRDEVEAAIELTQELLKAVYQYEHLLKRLQALRKP